MKPTAKIIILISLFSVFIATQSYALPINAGDTVRMTEDPNVPYTMELLDVKGDILETYSSFCLESELYFSPGNEYYVYSTGQTVDMSGVPVETVSKKLYAAYMSGIFDSLGSDNVVADKVQSGIWQSQGQAGGSASVLLQLTSLSDYISFDDSSWNVFAVNLSTNSTGYPDKQSQLVGVAPVPEPATMLLFGTGLVGLVGSRLRKKKG